MMHMSVFKWALAVFAVLIVACFSGCGKKGPPLPPENKTHNIAAPHGVELTLLKNEVRLTWKHSVDAATAVVEPEEFEIFMVKKTFDDCEGCPFRFVSAGRVSVPDMVFYLPVEKGFQYYFRVQAVKGNQLKSPYSETVQVDIP